jgi:hypothetical protein
VRAAEWVGGGAQQPLRRPAGGTQTAFLCPGCSLCPCNSVSMLRCCESHVQSITSPTKRAAIRNYLQAMGGELGVAFKYLIFKFLDAMHYVYYIFHCIIWT